MAENKIELIKELAECVNDNNEEISDEGKSILIFISDDKKGKRACVFAGDIISLIMLHNDIEEEINKALTDVLGELLEDLKKKLEDK